MMLTPGVRELTTAKPERACEPSGLKQRLDQCGSALVVREMPGGRLGFQGQSLAYVRRRAPGSGESLARDGTRRVPRADLAGILHPGGRRLDPGLAGRVLGLSPPETPSCGLPVVASEVGEMVVVLLGHDRPFAREDDAAAAEPIERVAGNPLEARAQALRSTGPGSPSPANGAAIRRSTNSATRRRTPPARGDARGRGPTRAAGFRIRPILDRTR